VAKRFLNVSPGDFGFNYAADFCRPIYPILREGGTDSAAKAPAAHLTKAAGASQRRALLDEEPRRRRNPIAVFSLLPFPLRAGLPQLPKRSRELILLGLRR